MAIRERGLAGEEDLHTMIALARAFPSAHPHVADLPYRLSSWALDDSRNVRLWVDDEGSPVAWACLQPPFWAIDCVCHPEVEAMLYRKVSAWATRRAREVSEAGSDVTRWCVTVFPEQTGRRRNLEGAGFRDQSDLGEDAWSKVLFEQPIRSAVGDSAPPRGFLIRPLGGEGEAEAYVAIHRAVFGTRNMTAAWRLRTLRRPEHLADLDLVAVAPDGSLAGFCVGWIARTGEAVTGQIEPLGVLGAHRRLGLGRALIAEELRRMREHGAESVIIETDNYRDAALGLYPQQDSLCTARCSSTESTSPRRVGHV